MYCMKCGKELQDGVPCVCAQEQVVEQNEVEQETKNENVNENIKAEQPKKETKGAFTNFLKNFGLIFIKPGTAIKDSITNKRWVNGLIYILIFSLISGISGMISSGWSSLSYYNSRVEIAQDNYQSAKRNFSLNDSYYNSRMLEIAENSLEVAKDNRIERIFSFDFIIGLVGRFIQNFITPVLTVILITALLLLLGKIFKGNGGFAQVLAGVGLSYNIKYLSSMILPLLARIPFIGGVFSSAITGISAVFGIYIYFVAKETFEIDENKSALAVFFSVWIAALISRIILSI